MKRKLFTNNVKQSILPDIWQYLSYPTLLAFCLTAKQYFKTLKKKKTWTYLLKRDFDFVYEDLYTRHLYTFNPKEYYELRYLFSIKGPNWFNEETYCNLDQVVRNRLEQAALNEPEDEQTCWIFDSNDLVATISGYNRYAVIVKKIIHIDYEKYKINSPDSLKYYLRLLHGSTILAGRMLSFLDLFKAHANGNIKLIKTLPHY